jgi:hypothetical protein
MQSARRSLSDRAIAIRHQMEQSMSDYEIKQTFKLAAPASVRAVLVPEHEWIAIKNDMEK